MKRWISVKDRKPPDHWYGLIIADVRIDRPVFAHTSDDWHRREFPFADYFCGSWRASLLTSDSNKERAKVMYWLEIIDEELYPDIPNPVPLTPEKEK